MKAIPMGRNIFVVREEPVEQTKGGIILSDYSKKIPCEGVIVAIGPDVQNPLLKKGARVLYGPYAPHHLRVDIDFFGEEKEACIMTEDDIVAVYEETNSNNPSL